MFRNPNKGAKIMREDKLLAHKKNKLDLITILYKIIKNSYEECFIGFKAQHLLGCQVHELLNSF